MHSFSNFYDRYNTKAQFIKYNVVKNEGCSGGLCNTVIKCYLKVIQSKYLYHHQLYFLENCEISNRNTARLKKNEKNSLVTTCHTAHAIYTNDVNLRLIEEILIDKLSNVFLILKLFWLAPR